MMSGTHYKAGYSSWISCYSILGIKPAAPLLCAEVLWEVWSTGWFKESINLQLERIAIDANLKRVYRTADGGSDNQLLQEAQYEVLPRRKVVTNVDARVGPECRKYPQESRSMNDISACV